MLKEKLDSRTDLQEYLYTRGFLLSDKEQDEKSYPFYGKWNHTVLGKYHFYVHPLNKLYLVAGEKRACFLIGHAYNPFTMEISEEAILKQMTDAKRDDLFSALNELTGVFTFGFLEDGKVTLISDCASMQIAYYGIIDGCLYVSTHMQLIGDLCGLRKSKYVETLTHDRFYHMYGNFLPGDLSSYDELKRIVPNTYVEIDGRDCSIHRFYPKNPLDMVNTEEKYWETVRKIGDILHRNMELIAEKWGVPAISMTGGMDSKATVASAEGLYDRFRYFSYVSMPGEQIDADAAHKIASAIGVEHQIDKISSSDSDFSDIESVREIIRNNYGNIGKQNSNDVRKRAYYCGNKYFDVEVKSWVSEIGRANYYKKFGFKKMPKSLSPRQMSTMYKFFAYNRKLLHETDKIFKDYISRTELDKIFNFDASDMFLWEVRYGSWGGQVITCEHKYSFDITIPYNNRKLLELMLSTPLEKRILDQLHEDIIRCMNPTISDTGITITNYNETKSRMWKEKLYYLVNTHLPF